MAAVSLWRFEDVHGGSLVVGEVAGAALPSPQLKKSDRDTLRLIAILRITNHDDFYSHSTVA